jgi:hypothetical protein
MCRAGQGVVRELFEEFDAEELRGFIVWLPMLPDDNAEAAETQSALFQDERVAQYWDPERAAGDLFAGVLSLRNTAWDVYLLYGAEVRWEGDGPPEPSFWMHQLPEQWGARQEQRLDAERLSAELRRLLEGRAG